MLYDFIENPTWLKFFLQIFPWCLLFFCTFYAFKALFFRKESGKFTGYHIIQHVPATFVTLGVLGTFAGVTYGLLDFQLQPDQIGNSITGLLSGLKNAFFTSLYGLFSSFVFSIIIRYQYSSQTLKDPDEEAHQKLLLNLKLSIDNFGQNLAKYNSEAIMSSLKQVIEDFNDTFTELIGELVTDNFKNLTSSVDQLVEWQQKYREDVNNILNSNKQLNTRTVELLQSFERVNQNISQISESSQTLKRSLDSLRESIENESSLSGLITQLEKTTGNLVTVSNDADLFKNEIQRIVSNLVDTQQNIKGWLDGEAGIRDAAHALNHTLTELRNFDVTKIKKLDESFNNRLQDTFRNLDRLMRSYIKYLEDKHKNGQSGEETR